MAIGKWRRKRFACCFEVVNEFSNLFSNRKRMQMPDRDDGQGNYAITSINNRQREFAAVGHLPYDACIVGDRKCPRRSDVERVVYAAVRNIA
jgi:hypothetical protein